MTLRKRGYAVDQEDDPLFVEPSAKTTKQELKLTNATELGTAVAGLLHYGPGSILGVPNFGHFGSLNMWFEVAAKVAALKGRIECAETGEILDPSKGEDVARGAKMVNDAINRRKGRTMTEKRVEMGITGGAPPKLTGKRLVDAQEMFVDLSISIPEIAEKLGVSRSTVIRAMGVGRAEAIGLQAQGKWPPKKETKRRASNLKPVES